MRKVVRCLSPAVAAEERSNLLFAGSLGARCSCFCLILCRKNIWVLTSTKVAVVHTYPTIVYCTDTACNYLGSGVLRCRKRQVVPVLLHAPPAPGTPSTLHQYEHDAPPLTSTSSLELVAWLQDVGGNTPVEIAPVKLSSCRSERSNKGGHHII